MLEPYALGLMTSWKLTSCVAFLINVQFAAAQEGLSETSNLISPKIMPQAAYFLRPLLLRFR